MQQNLIRSYVIEDIFFSNLPNLPLPNKRRTNIFIDFCNIRS